VEESLKMEADLCGATIGADGFGLTSGGEDPDWLAGPLSPGSSSSPERREFGSIKILKVRRTRPCDRRERYRGVGAHKQDRVSQRQRRTKWGKIGSQS